MDIVCLRIPVISLYPLQAWEFSQTRLARLLLLSQFFLVILVTSQSQSKEALRFKGSRLVRHKPSPFVFTVSTATLCFKEICLYKQRNWKGRKLKPARGWISKVVCGFTFSRRKQQGLRSLSTLKNIVILAPNAYAKTKWSNKRTI